MTPDRLAGHRLRMFVHQQLGEAIPDTDLAERLGVSKQAVGAWWRGNEPSLASLRGLAKVVGVKRFELVRCWDGE